jgi:magnesium transporter
VPGQQSPSLSRKSRFIIAALSGGIKTKVAQCRRKFETDIAKAVILTLFIPLIMSAGGNSGSQATSLIIRALALQELRLAQWWHVAMRELPTGIGLGAILGVGWITLW